MMQAADNNKKRPCASSIMGSWAESYAGGEAAGTFVQQVNDIYLTRL